MGFLKTAYNKIRRGFLKGNDMAYNTATFLKQEIPRLQSEYSHLKKSIQHGANDISPELGLITSNFIKMGENNPLAIGISSGLQEGKVMANRLVQVEDKVKHHSDLYQQRRHHQAALHFAGN